MNMRKWSVRGRAVGMAAVAIGPLLAAAGLASPASADHDVLEQISTGPAGGNGEFIAGFAGASADGARVFFLTAERLVSADHDGASSRSPA